MRKNSKWYAIFSVERIYPIFKFIDPKKSVAIDLGVKHFIVDSNGNRVDKPKPEKRLIRRLKLIQRKLSRRKPNSKNYQKAKKWYQVIHERIQRKRLDFLHKLSRDYANKYDIIFVERLNTKNMLEDKALNTNKQNNTLHRNIADSAFRRFVDMLKYKAKLLIQVDPKGTTQECYNCGTIVPKELKDRIHYCPKCNIKIDRDLNASLNILKRGLEYLPMEHGEVTLGEITKAWSMNQEASSVRAR